MKDRTFETFGMSVILAAEATFGGKASPVYGKDLRYKAPDNGDKNQTVIYDANEWLNNGKLVPATQTPENPQSPEQQEKLLDPFPTFAIKLGEASEFGVNGDSDIKALNDHNSEVYKKIALSDDYNRLDKVLTAVGALQKATYTPDIDYNPYIFAGVKDNDLYISGAAVGDNFHQLVFYGVTKTTVTGRESNLGILLQVQVSDFNRYTPGMALVKDNETGTITYTPFVRDNQNPSESGMIKNPFGADISGRGQVTPQPTPDPNLFAADNMVFARWVDGKYEETKPEKKLVAFVKSEKWMDKNASEVWFESAEKEIAKLDRNSHYTLKAWTPGANPTIVLADKVTRAADGRVLRLNKFDYNLLFQVDDGDGGRVDAQTALAMQVRHFMDVAADEDGMIGIPVQTGVGEYGPIIKKVKISKDIPVIFQFGTDRKVDNVARNGFGAQFGGIYFSYSVTSDGSLYIYLDNSDYYTPTFFKATNEQKDDGIAYHITDSVEVSLLYLVSQGGDLMTMWNDYVNKARTKGMRDWIWIRRVKNVPVFTFKTNNASGGDKGDPRIVLIFDLQGRVS